MALMRLQKFLSKAGYCSRRRGEKYIKNGRVRVNGVIITELGAKVDPDKDRVEADGESLVITGRLIYIALNKPRGYVTSCSHPGEKVVLDLIDIPERIWPVGRLDKDSTGLLLLTNDGGLHQRLSHPSYDHEKEYEVTVASPVSDNALRRMARGIYIMGKKTRPAIIRRVSRMRFHIILKEGRNRQIRRMVRNTGNRVIHLKRIRISDIKLGRLGLGKWRYLTEREKTGLVF